MSPVARADVLDDDIDAAIVGEPSDFVGDGHESSDRWFVGAEVASAGEFLRSPPAVAMTRAPSMVRPGRRPRRRRSEQRERGRSSPASESGARDEHVPGGEEAERDGGGLRPVEILRIRETVDLGHTNIFGATAVDHVDEISVKLQQWLS